MNIIGRKIRDWRNAREIKRRRATASTSVVQVHEEYQRKMSMVSETALIDASLSRGAGAFGRGIPRPKFSLVPYTPPFDGIAPDKAVLAMDAAMPPGVYSQNSTGMFVNGGFPGFAYLTELMQINEYRDLCESTPNEMTRKWIEFRTTGEDDRDEIIKKLESAMKKLHVKEWFNWAGRFGYSQGRSQLFLDFGDNEPEELALPLVIQKEKIKKGSLKRIKGIEPITTYPASYNADDPLAPDYYVPSQWYVYSKAVHATRLLTFIPFPLPDLLKPVFNFSGMSISQLAQPYVDYWLSSRDSVSKLMKNFATTVFQTDMTGILQGQNYEGFKRRLQFYVETQNNQGVFMIDKTTEDLKKENTPLSGLDKLLAQSQEHMASVAKTPLTILFGLSPVGLTATAESDITIFNNHVNSMQEMLFRRPLEDIIKVIMLSEFGESYDDIVFDFVDLVSMNGKEKALIRKSNGETDAAYITAGVITPEEVRAKVAADSDSGYNGINVRSPDGTLQTPQPGGKPGVGEGGSEGGGNPDASFTAEENSNDERNALMRQAADLMIQDACQMANDAGLWPGNQHTDKLNDGHPSTNAMRHSVVAQKATNIAHMSGSKAAHATAAQAHRRALNAHKLALGSATRENRPVHEAYIDAHESAIAHHQIESAPKQEEVEL